MHPLQKPEQRLWYIPAGPWTDRSTMHGTDRSMTGLQPPNTFSTRNSNCKTSDPAGPWFPVLPSGAFWRLPPEELMHDQTPEHRMTAPGVPVTQVGGDGTGSGILAGGLQPSIHRRRITARHANADSEHLPTAAARETRNLQNFFPFPRREEEEEALEDDNIEEEGRKDDTDKDPAGLLDCCCWREGWEKCYFFPFDAGLSQEMAFQIALSWSTIENFSTAFSRTSARNKSDPVDSFAFLKSMKDSNDIESFTFASTSSPLFRMTLAHRVDVILTTRNWHLAPARLVGGPYDAHLV